jgi:hypothetical protein
MTYNDVIQNTGKAIDAVGVTVIMVGALMGAAIAAVRLARREGDVYRQFR